MTTKADRRIVAGNWKMNTTPREGAALVEEIIGKAGGSNGKVIFGAPAIQLVKIMELIDGQDAFYASRPEYAPRR